MNALKRVRNETKSEREKQQQRLQTVNESVEFFKYACAIILYDMFGFRNKRITRFVNALVDLFVQYSDRYDSKYLLDSMKKQCSDRGIEFEG